jgi:hypothetical protein
MAKRGRPPKGTQLDLIEVGPENLKKIIPIAREYKELVSARVEILKKEVEAKQELLELVEQANLSRTKDGKIRFVADGYTITITPRDNLVQVKEITPPAAGE